MVALWLRNTKTDVVKLLSFLVHKMAVMPVVHAHVCVYVCVQTICRNRIRVFEAIYTFHWV